MVVNRLKIPRVSPHSSIVGGVKFPQGEGSTVIHRKKNDLLHKDATYNNLWQSVVVNRLKIPRVSPHPSIVGGVKFP